jgi:hypothetical protein
MNLCIYKMYLFVCFIYNVSKEFRVYIFLIACSSKNLCGIAQLGAGYVTVCSAERIKAFFHVSWPVLGGQGRYILAIISRNGEGEKTFRCEKSFLGYKTEPRAVCKTLLREIYERA